MAPVVNLDIGIWIRGQFDFVENMSPLRIRRAENAQIRLNLFRARHGVMVLPPKLWPELRLSRGDTNSRLS